MVIWELLSFLTDTCETHLSLSLVRVILGGSLFSFFRPAECRLSHFFFLYRPLLNSAHSRILAAASLDIYSRRDDSCPATMNIFRRRKTKTRNFLEERRLTSASPKRRHKGLKVSSLAATKRQTFFSNRRNN